MSAVSFVKPLYAIRCTTDGYFYCGGVEGHNNGSWDDSLVRLYSRLDLLAESYVGGRPIADIEVIEIVGLNTNKSVSLLQAREIGNNYRLAMASWVRRRKKAEKRIAAELAEYPDLQHPDSSMSAIWGTPEYWRVHRERYAALMAEGMERVFKEKKPIEPTLSSY